MCPRGANPYLETGHRPAVRDETAFDDAEFLGLARHARRDPRRLGLFAQHFEPDERSLALLPIAGGTLIVTDRRLLEFRMHLEVDGAWNVREFAGYTVAREVPLESIIDVARRTNSSESSGSGIVEDALHIMGAGGAQEFVLSRGPDRVVPDEDVALLVTLLGQRSRSLS